MNRYRSHSCCDAIWPNGNAGRTTTKTKKRFVEYLEWIIKQLPVAIANWITSVSELIELYIIGFDLNDAILLLYYHCCLLLTSVSCPIVVQIVRVRTNYLFICMTWSRVYCSNQIKTLETGNWTRTHTHTYTHKNTKQTNQRMNFKMKWKRKWKIKKK